jgi:beta-phosphoglucomutase-like phosphatase (HAD superfamily)
MRAAIFDFDGVLVNSEPLHFRSLRASLEPEGIRISEREYFTTYLAYDDRRAIRLAFEQHGVALDLERLDRIANRKAGFFEEMLPEVPFFPGSRELARSLSRTVPVAIASGALSEEIERILTAGRIRDAFTAIVGADNVSRGKPDPEPYLEAMRRLSAAAPGLEPARCLVFEDSVPGIVSALAAGMKVVAVSNSFPAAKLSAAHRVVASLEGLANDGLQALFQS